MTTKKTVKKPKKTKKKATAKKPKTEVNKGGRPPLNLSTKLQYDQAFKLCLLGATDEQIGDFYGVTARTITRWKEKDAKFMSSLKEGKEIADLTVADSLYNKAVGGYETTEVVKERVKKTDSKGKVTYELIETKHVIKKHAPDTTSMIFWLKNRVPDKWREKYAHELTGKDGAQLVKDATDLLDDKALVDLIVKAEKEGLTTDEYGIPEGDSKVVN